MKLKHLFRSHSLRFGLLSVFLLTAAGLHAQSAATPQTAPPRPKITGISHVGYFVSDLPAAISFWHDLLGYDEYFTLPKKDGSGTRIAFIKINDHQHIELFNEPPTTPHNFMSHICFTVDNVQQMRVYLRSKGFDVKDSNGKTKTGDYAFEIKDPDGMLVEFVQSLPDGVEMQNAGKHLPSTRISDSIYHAGFMVGNSQKSIDFYGGPMAPTTWSSCSIRTCRTRTSGARRTISRSPCRTSPSPWRSLKPAPPSSCRPRPSSLSASTASARSTSTIRMARASS